MDISIWITRPASPQLPIYLSYHIPDLSTEKHVPVLQRFFHIVIGELSGGFADTLVDLARQLWDSMVAHCTRREYASRTAKATWVDLAHPLIRHNDNDPSCGPSSFCLLLFLGFSAYQSARKPFGGAHSLLETFWLTIVVLVNFCELIPPHHCSVV